MQLPFSYQFTIISGASTRMTMIKGSFCPALVHFIFIYTIHVYFFMIIINIRIFTFRSVKLGYIQFSANAIRENPNVLSSALTVYFLRWECVCQCGSHHIKARWHEWKNVTSACNLHNLTINKIRNSFHKNESNEINK